MEFDTQSIEKAVHEFYYSPVGQAEAHQWLTLAQMSPKAWTFCWDLMQLDKPPEIQFFGANCLYIKISKCWCELPVEQYTELKNKLVQYIVAYATGGVRIVLTRLCVALSHFIIRTLPEHWTSAIPELMATFQPSNIVHLPPDRTLEVLLEMLTVLPEEFQSTTLAQSFRGIVRNQLHTNLTHVLPLIHQTLTAQRVGPPLRLQSLRCLSSWITFGIPLPDCGELLSAVLGCVADGELCESAVEVLCNVVIHPDAHKYSTSLLKLFDHLLQLETVLVRAQQNKDMDVCSTLYNLFISVGESHSRLLLEESLKSEHTKNSLLKLVRLILQCSGIPGQYPVDETCSSLAFSFWYSFQDDIISLAADRKNLDIYMVYFVPVYKALVDVLLQKVAYPRPEDYRTWNTDEKEQLRCYRQDIGDTLMYCYNLLHEEMLAHLLGRLEDVLVRGTNDADVGRGLEACLFGFQSVAESVDPDDLNYVPKLFALLPSLPYNNNTQVIATALDAIGAYAEWINQHPEVLSNIIPLLVTGLNSATVAPSATIALKDITRDCQRNMQPFAPSILQACQGVLSKGCLKPHEQVRIMFTIGYVSSILPNAALLPFLNGLLTPYIQELEHFGEPKMVNLSQQPRLLLRLNMLSTLFFTLDTKQKENSDDEVEGGEKHTSSASAAAAAHARTEQQQEQPEPVLLVLQQILPVLRRVGIAWKGCHPVAESICELMKKAVSNLLDDCSPAVVDMLDLLFFLLQSRANAAALDLLKQFILLFAKDDNQKIYLKRTFLNVSNLTLDLCAKGMMSEDSDVVEGFLQLLAQLMKKHPQFLLDDEFNISALFVFAIVALSVPEAPTVKSAASFLVSLISQSREAPQLTNVVNTNGEALLQQALRCIGGESPRGVMDSMADILLALNKKYFDNMCRWMNTCLNQENFPSPNVTREQKERFIRLVLKERSNKRKLQETVKEFTLMCRGLIGTEYGVQVLNCL